MRGEDQLCHSGIAVGTFTPTRGHHMMTYKMMSQSDMDPIGAESAAFNREVNDHGGMKRLGDHLLLPGQQPLPQKRIIFKIKKAVSTKVLDPLPNVSYDSLIRNGGK